MNKRDNYFTLKSLQKITKSNIYIHVIARNKLILEWDYLKIMNISNEILLMQNDLLVVHWNNVDSFKEYEDNFCLILKDYLLLYLPFMDIKRKI